MRTVVQFIDNLQAGGKERQCVELVKGLSTRGDTRSVIVTMTPELFFTELETLPHVQVEYLVRHTRQDPTIFLRFFALCRKWRVDVIGTWHVMTALYALPAARLLRIPLVANFIQDAPEPVPPRLARRSRLAFALADAVVACSNAGVRAYAPPPAKTRVIPSGYDLARVAVPPDAQWLRREYTIEPPLVVGMVATFSEFKDQPTLIRAAELVLAVRRDVVFVLVGGGPTLEACRALVPAPLAAHVRLVGRVAAAIEQVVAGFDIGVLATFTEGMSNSIVEYMVLGKPVVATDGGGNSDLVHEGVNGYLVPARDARALADRLLLLLADEPLRRAMGQAGRERVEREFRMELVVDQYAALYAALASGRPQRMHTKPRP